ncbi:MAG: CHAT domain-containing tetratricopeptide repeat protein [Candidatus Methanoperedens sp.]
MSKMQTDSSKIPSKGELLLQMAQKLTERTRFFQQAVLSKNKGDLDSARIWYDRLIAVSYEYLQLALLHNRYHEYPVEITSIVQPLLDTLLIQADILQAKGDIPTSEKLWADAQKLSKEHLGSSEVAEIERSRSVSIVSQGRFNEALVGLAASKDFFQQEGNMLKLARTTLDMVSILNWLGDFNRALSELSNVSGLIAPLILEKAPTQQDIVDSLFSAEADIRSGTGDGRKAQDTAQLYRIFTEINFYKGLINRSAGNLDEAEKFFEIVMPEYQKMEVEEVIEAQLVSILLSKGKNQEALSRIIRLEPHFRNHDFFRPKLASLLRWKAEALFNLGRMEQAINSLDEGIADLNIYYDPDRLWGLQWLKGRILEAMNKEVAIEFYSKAIDTVNDLRKAPLGYRLDSTYLKDKIPLFRGAIELACKMDRAKECCGFMEMIKSRILTATLSITNPMPKDHNKTGDIGKKIDELTRKLDGLEYSGYRDGWSNEIKNERSSILLERSELMERVRFSDPRWRSMTEPVPLDLDRITEILDDRGQAALNLFYGSDRIIAVLIKDTKYTVAQIELPSEINSKLEEYRLNLQEKYPDKTFYDISTGLAIGAKHLIPYDLLMKALESTQLIIIPHGPLHLIPWAGLIFKGKRLFEYCPVGILPNLTSIINLDADFSNPPAIALIGSPDYGSFHELNSLPYAQKEIEHIRQLYSDKQSIIGNVLNGNKATEKGFWELLSYKNAENGILHVSSHGSFEPNEPMNSGLLLADAKIDAAEIARSSVKYNEVILSACSSGWRPTKVQGIELSGDDILGLPGSFLEAGARSVLVSIPMADDRATCRFMTIYHHNRLNGKTPLTSLQETQNTMLSNSEYEPFTWIGFTVYGCQ